MSVFVFVRGESIDVDKTLLEISFIFIGFFSSGSERGINCFICILSCAPMARLAKSGLVRVSFFSFIRFIFIRDRSSFSFAGILFVVLFLRKLENRFVGKMIGEVPGKCCTDFVYSLRDNGYNVYF